MAYCRYALHRQGKTGSPDLGMAYVECTTGSYDMDLPSSGMHMACNASNAVVSVGDRVKGETVVLKCFVDKARERTSTI